MNPPRTDSRKSGITRHAEAAILFAVGPYRFAIAATEVDEIRDMQGLTPISARNAPVSIQKVRHLLRRNRHTYHVIDASFHFHLLPSKPSRVMVLRNGLLALTVDSIDRMIDIAAIAPLPRAFHGEERNWYRGLALVDNLVVPVVNSASVLTKAELELTRASIAATEGASA